MGSKYTKRYTDEFRRDAIALVDSSGKTVTAVARELGISSQSLRGRYRKAQANRGEGTPGDLSGDEREELKLLRRENREQQQTIEFCCAGFCMWPAPLTTRGARAKPPVMPGRPPTTRLRTRSRCCTSPPAALMASRASTPNCAVWGGG
ncbi:transposase [Streptomyces sp. SID13726]|nr:transposase [Streptomyces sp. SID13726]